MIKQTLLKSVYMNLDMNDFKIKIDIISSDESLINSIKITFVLG